MRRYMPDPNPLSPIAASGMSIGTLGLCDRINTIAFRLHFAALDPPTV